MRAPPSQLCKQDVVAGPNVVKPGSYDLRVSTKSEGSPVSSTRTLPMTSSNRPNHSPNHNPNPSPNPSRRSRQSHSPSRSLQSHSPSRSLENNPRSRRVRSRRSL